LDCTILQPLLHILLFGLHKIGWTAPLEYAVLPSSPIQHSRVTVRVGFEKLSFR